MPVHNPLSGKPRSAGSERFNVRSFAALFGFLTCVYRLRFSEDDSNMPSTSIVYDNQRLCVARSRIYPMKKHVMSLIAVLIGMAFLASCEQSGTPGTSTTTAAMSNPSPTPASKRSARRNPPKTQGSSEAPSPIPGGSTAPAPTP